MGRNQQHRQYQVIRSNRKTISLQVLDEKSLLVRAPYAMSELAIEDFVQLKKKWVDRARLQMKEKERQLAMMSFGDGNPFLLLGKTYHLQVRLLEPEHEKPGVKLLAGTERLEVLVASGDQVREVLFSYLSQLARWELPPLVKDWAHRMQVNVGLIRIRQQRTRWGSCSSLGHINLNARIMMAPTEVIEYLVIHELAHRVHPHHGRTFYQLVEQYCPQYRIHQYWLKEHAFLLAL